MTLEMIVKIKRAAEGTVAPWIQTGVGPGLSGARIPPCELRGGDRDACWGLVYRPRVFWIPLVSYLV